ncbi:hypothetical protein XENOCAPTIV_003889 [Xenoophorus captivus]|uniref:Secreted protein n=1 Tax=Xenoophorus captivus TaxID=1517983 RepID=A0ABV0Q7W5_9TELE
MRKLHLLLAGCCCLQQNKRKNKQILSAVLLETCRGCEAKTTSCFKFDQNIGLQAIAQEGRAVSRVAHALLSVLTRGSCVWADICVPFFKSICLKSSEFIIDSHNI